VVAPHGGKLTERVLTAQERKKILETLDSYKFVTLDREQVKEAKNIAQGVFSPLTGFLKKKDFQEVVKRMRLTQGQIWPIPIVLDIPPEKAKEVRNEEKIILIDEMKQPVALLREVEIYSYNKDLFAKNVFGTTDKKHPGVENVYRMEAFLLGGELFLLDNSKEPFPEYNFSPRETRKIFRERGWKTIVAFQTRNVPHRSHEFLQKEALKEADGLFIQPVIGEKKLEDFKDEYILTGYEILIKKYYPAEKVLLGILPLRMRYAGPREALFHALIRKNYGCTHFIVGRDHAGAKGFYPPFAAQEIFNDFKEQELGIQILKYPEVVYCPALRKHTFISECPDARKLSLSGTDLRQAIKKRRRPPSYIMRPEVYKLLAGSYNSLVDHMYKRPNHKNQKGFVLWFTGLSQSGKTTIADKVYQILKARNIKVERLDGDLVRQHLSKELGFSKKDRDENIRRVGFVSKLLSKNGIGVIASFISPYKAEREGVRKQVENFIEVFCNCPLEVCERRDKKGLYKKARQGKIRSFTGISDPYEKPENPEIELFTDKETVEENAGKIIKYLQTHQLI